MTNQTLTLPHKFEPRWYQKDLLSALDGGIKRACCVWHRRAGKDKTLWNYLIKKAVEVPGIYYYFLPTYSQGKKVIWEGYDARSGLSFIDHIPKELIVSKNASEMKIELFNRSVIRVVGTDNYDTVRGTNPIGCVFSEYAFQDPRAWDVVRPILDENGGWAIFNSTPNGANHFHVMHKLTKDDPTWFTQILTIEDSGVIDPGDIEQARAEGVDEDTIQREYYCSFEASIAGAYYGVQMAQALEQGRISNVPLMPNYEVYTAWDLGRNDQNSIWFFQVVGKSFHFIDYFEHNGEDISYYIRHLRSLQEQYGIVYAKHFLPHDAEYKTIHSPYSIKETFKTMGMNNVIVVPRTASIQNDIQATRAILAQCYFDEDECRDGIAALRSYAKNYDEKNKVFQDKARHDWASHGADAFRTFAVGWRDYHGEKKSKFTQKQVRYNPLTGQPM